MFALVSLNILVRAKASNLAESTTPHGENYLVNLVVGYGITSEVTMSGLLRNMNL